jgi:hypothetical protein
MNGRGFQLPAPADNVTANALRAVAAGDIKPARKTAVRVYRIIKVTGDYAQIEDWPIDGADRACRSRALHSTATSNNVQLSEVSVADGE